MKNLTLGCLSALLATGFTALPAQASSVPSVPGAAYTGLFNPNKATPDTGWWARAAKDFYISAVPLTNKGALAKNANVDALKTGGKVFLYDFLQGGNLRAGSVSWLINSKYGSIHNEQTGTIRGSALMGFSQQETDTTGIFSATKTGIYTIQARDNATGQYSVPMVLTVGLSSLRSVPVPQSGRQSGVMAMGAPVSPVYTQTANGVSFTPGAPVGNWIPVQGSVAANVTSITIVLWQNGSVGKVGRRWDYRIPVANGSFSDLVRWPYAAGSVHVTFYPEFLKSNSQSTSNVTGVSSISISPSYTVTTEGSSLSARRLALLADTSRNFNTYPGIAQFASAFLENSQSVDTAMAAMNNYVAEAVQYNASPAYIYQTAQTTLQTDSGVCKGIADLAAAMGESAGIPVQMVGGYANSLWSSPPTSDTNPNDLHQWISFWNGSAWIVMDPTWTSAPGRLVRIITNWMQTNTTRFKQTHLASTAPYTPA